MLDLKERSGFNEDNFLKFISSCELEFNYKLSSETPITTQGQVRKKEDIEKIFNLLTKMAGGERRIVEMSKDDMLEMLSWTRRFKHKFVHEFPVYRTYQEIEETVDAISEVLAQTKSGYIALIGSPGSGKSTTLTRTLKYKSGYKLVRYYAYVPDSTYQGRGEANTFLHDITLSLRNHGFRGESSGQPGSREEYLSLLGEQLQQAHEKWKNDQVITIVMVDGLDHIQREQNPLQSLLSDLPSPNTIPKGVIFVLGTQTLELKDLSDSIKEHIKHESRTIVISPLTRSNVYAVINEWSGCAELTDDNKKAIFEKSLGHPLSLVYLLQYIIGDSGKSFDELIDEFPLYQGHIEQSYSIYWRQIESNKDLVNLLALLSRIRVPINTQVLDSWADHTTIYQFVSSAAHYFKKDSDISWRFFHNSFRQFILDKTSHNLFGKYDSSKDIEYHKILADYALQSAFSEPMRWEAIYHLFNAKQPQTVIEVGMQSYFREQFFSLRNLSDITDDINFVLLSAKELNDPLAVVRCILIESELRERNAALNEVDLLNLIFASEGLNAALNYMFDGELLRVSDSEALRFSKVLAENEFFNDAKRIFFSAEPLNYLTGGDRVDPHHRGDEDLKRWVDVAHYFIPIENIISAIYQTRYEDNDVAAWDISDEDLHIRLMRRLVNSIYATNNEGKIEELFSFFAEEKKYFDAFLSLCFSICQAKSPMALTNAAFQVVIDWCDKEGDNLDVSDVLLATELEYRIYGSIERSKKWFSDVKQPDLYKFGLHGQWKNLSPFTDRIRLNRLLAALGKNLDPVKLVPNEDEQKFTGNVLFERGLVRFSNVWGKAWADKKLSPRFIVHEIKPLFELLRMPYSQTRDWTGWYEIERSAIDFFKFAIRATSQHHLDCILTLADAFLEDWGKRYWPTSWRREIAFALYEAGAARDSLVSVLEQIEKEVPEFDEINSKVSEYYELAIVWSKIGESARATVLIPKIFKGSFGIYHHKDRQFSLWVSWLGKLIDQYPDLAYDEVCRFSSALVNLEQSGNGRGTQEGGRDLIALSTRWNAEYGLQLLRWLFDHKGLHYGPGLTGFLSGLLNRPSPPFKEISIVASKLLIPFEEYNPSDLARLFVTLYHSSSSGNNRVLTEKLITSIKTHSLPSNRYSWLEGIALGVRDAGEDNTKYASIAISTPQEKHVTHEPSLKLNTGDQLTQDEVQLKVCSLESLFQLLQSVESVDYFRWKEIVQPYLKNMNVGQLDALFKLLQPFKPDNSVVTSIARALYEIGEISKANNLLKGLFDNSDPKGWDLHWDGGSKQSLFRALVEIDDEHWRPKAISSLVDDYISEYRYPNSLLWNLEEIVNILFKNLDIMPVWLEIKEHVYQLDDFKEEEDSSKKPPKLIEHRQITNDSSLLIQFAFDMFDVGIPELAHMAHQTIVELSMVEENWPEINKEIVKRINKPGLLQIKTMSLLMSLEAICKDLVLQFKAVISSLCSSEEFRVRMAALDLCTKLEIESCLPLESRSKLPLLYKLELPEIENKKEAIPFSAMKPGETLPDIDDPIELLRPLLDEAQLVADMSNIPFENIVHRTVELMKTLVPESEWSKQAEEDYREWLEGIDLKLTYRRIRPLIAKLALCHVVCELVDARNLPHNEAYILKLIFKCGDQRLLAVEPCVRPECIVIPKVKDRDITHNHDVWLDDIEQAFRHIITCIGPELEIIGELTTWVWLDWDKPTEIRMSTICHPDWNNEVDIKSPSKLFPSKMHWSADEYPDNTVTNKPSLVIYGSDSYIDHGGYDWLALNPAIGISLGWSFSSEGLFRWVDENDNLMAESIYWKDGPISRQPPKLDDICSNGWLVVVTQKAADQIRKVIGEAVKVDAVVRSYGKGTYNPKSICAQKRSIW